MDLDEFYCIAQNTVEMLEDLLEAAEEDINLEEHDVMRELVKQGQRMERKLTSIIDENNESARCECRYMNLNATLRRLLDSV